MFLGVKDFSPESVSKVPTGFEIVEGIKCETHNPDIKPHQSVTGTGRFAADLTNGSGGTASEEQLG